MKEETSGWSFTISFSSGVSLYLNFLLQLQIWDTAGQERFRTITQSYYRSANGVVIAYDITKHSSFESVPRWMEDVKRYAGNNIVQLLVGEDSSLAVQMDKQNI